MDKVFKKIIFVGLLLVIAGTACAHRVTQTINDGWKFSLYAGDASAADFDVAGWTDISIPHTWNAKDAEDEIPGYYRGKGWYRKAIVVEELIPGQKVYLKFEGSNQVTSVFVNGQLAGTHKGGYSAFTFDVTEYVHTGRNLVAVSVDNSHDPDIAPLSADFTFFGGIYRDVYLVYTSPVGISTTHYASSGVYLKASEISDLQAEISVMTYLSNALEKNQTLILETEILDAGGHRVALFRKKVNVKAGEENVAFESSMTIAHPKRWDIDSPYIYKVYSRILDKKGMMLDCVVNPLGIREYAFDADKGFFLNGKYRKLIGTSRHQDYKGMGNALRDEMHIRDIQLSKDMGSNFLRVAHYPQDPVVMQMCDKLGLLTSVEIPIVNAVTPSDAFLNNCVEQVTEMIYQNYNSPSVIIWAYMNEVLLRPPFNSENSGDKAEYLKFLYKVASAIEDRIRSIDPERYTMLPCHSSHQIYQEAGITELPMLLGFNLYNGWYGGKLSGFEEKLEELHREFPHKPLLVTEYGADVDTRIHSFSPVRFDFSCEFGTIYHEHYLPEILKRDYVAGAMVWNLNDFYSEARRNAVPHVNNKGLVGTDRERKDGYYFYQAYLKESPVIHIASKTWKNRAGASRDGKVCMQPLKVYTNADKVKILLNGTSLGEYEVSDKVASLNIPFVDGENIVEAVIQIAGLEYRDQYVCNFKCINVKNDFTEMSVLLGTQRYFEDRTAEVCWIPEQAYEKGSWGYVGGEIAPNKTRYGSLPASDTDILGTNQDPVFQTQRMGIEAFKADVPDGVYAVYLYWTELTSENKREALAYNLGNDVVKENYSNRVFSVDINGVSVAKQLNIAEEFGSERAVIKKYVILVCHGNGLDIRFGTIESVPVLNAIRIVKEY